MANIQKGSILFNNLRQIVGRKSKSTFVYEADKTFAQRWIAKQTLKIKEQQKFHALDDGIPIWWKSTSDKVLTTFVFAATVGSFVVTMSNLIKFSNGEL